MDWDPLRLPAGFGGLGSKWRVGGSAVNQEPRDDVYEILQVSRNADFETIERVFRLLAKRYHPDNRETANEDKFRAVMEAYQVLSNPERRAAYDARSEGMRAEQWRGFYQPSSAGDGLDCDQGLRQGILSILYTTRRQSPSNPGVGIITLENLLGCPEQLMAFHLWYLKEKNLIIRTDTGEYAITVAGVDEISATPRPSDRGRLMPPTGDPGGNGRESACWKPSRPSP